MDDMNNKILESLFDFILDPRHITIYWTILPNIITFPHYITINPIRFPEMKKIPSLTIRELIFGSSLYVRSGCILGPRLGNVMGTLLTTGPSFPLSTKQRESICSGPFKDIRLTAGRIRDLHCRAKIRKRFGKLADAHTPHFYCRICVRRKQFGVYFEKIVCEWYEANSLSYTSVIRILYSLYNVKIFLIYKTLK